jgi:hypothetical protein
VRAESFQPLNRFASFKSFGGNRQHDGGALPKAAAIVNGDVTLAAYFQSMLAYFTGKTKPAETLLTLKLQAARYHPLPESDQVKFSGEYLLRD